MSTDKLWPTPSASQARSEGMIKQMRAKVEAGELTREEAEAMIQGSLEPARMKPMRRLWPTPRRSVASSTDKKGSPSMVKGKHGWSLSASIGDEEIYQGSEPVQTTQLTFSQEAFPVSPQVLPGSSEARQMTAGSGTKLSGLFRNSGPAGWCLRTLLESSAWSSTIVHLKWTTRRIRRQTSEIWVLRPTRLLNEQGEEYWMRLWSRSRVRVTKYGSTFIQLVPLTPRTDGIDSSLWGTPNSHPRTHSPRDVDHGVQLANQVALWSTPQATDATVGQHWAEADEVRHLKSGRIRRVNAKGTDGSAGLGREVQMWPTPRKGMTGAATPERTQDKNLNLETAVARAMWPTPAARDYRSPFAENSEAFLTRQEHPRGVNLVEQMQRDGNRGQLNPPWECSMMGFPPGWLDIESDGPTEPGKTDSRG